jgi:hypothetical protein
MRRRPGAPVLRLPRLGSTAAIVGRTTAHDALTAGNGSFLVDCQLDCQPLELPVFSLDEGAQAQVVYLHRWTATDGAGRAGKS